MEIRVGDPDTEYRSLCTYAGLTPGGPLCHKPAATHVMVRCPRNGIVMLTACAEHRAITFAIDGLLDTHDFAGVCGLPGTLWFSLPESHCEIDDSGVEPELAGALAVGAPA